MKLALAQLRIHSGDIDGNVARALAAIETAAQRGADLVALPEVFHVGYFAFDQYAAAAESLEGETLSTIADAAADHDVAVLAGTVIEDLATSRAAGIDTPAPDGYANTAVLFDAAGARRATYRKQHLFGYESAEQDWLTPGERLSTAALLGFTIGMTTCYDLRFPTLYRSLVDRDATLVLVPSAWPLARVEHWRLLPRSRAVENLMYVATINGVGTVEGTELAGRSAVYDPWGTTVAGAAEAATVVCTRIVPGRVTDVRERFPALDDRRARHDQSH